MSAPAATAASTSSSVSASTSTGRRDPVARTRRSGFGHAAGDRDVVVLDQDAVIQAHAMVQPTAADHGVLRQRSQAGNGLAGVENLDAAAGSFDELARPRGDPRQVLQDIERGSFRGEDAGRRPGDRGHAFARLAEAAVGSPIKEFDRGIHRGEHFTRHVEACDHARHVRDDRPGHPGICRHDGSGRHVARTDVLSQGLAHQPSVRGRIEPIRHRRRAARW